MNRLNIVLVSPAIPQNTGNIARTCAATGAALHLVEPLGFEITDKNLKRAGLDYWQYLELHRYQNLEEFFSENPEGAFYFFSTKAQKTYTDVSYQGDVYLFFGREDAGLPEALLAKHYDSALRFPMLTGIRSLNLANSVAIATYEVLRQWNFADLELQGKLSEYTQPESSPTF